MVFCSIFYSFKTFLRKNCELEVCKVGSTGIVVHAFYDEVSWGSKLVNGLFYLDVGPFDVFSTWTWEVPFTASVEKFELDGPRERDLRRLGLLAPRSLEGPSGNEIGWSRNLGASEQDEAWVCGLNPNGLC